MAEAREYWVGLPVGITVHPDGKVTWTIDSSEASSAMGEEWGEASEETNPTVAEYTQEQVLLDQAIVDAVSTQPTVESTPDERMKCPINYSCSFRTGNLGEMADHILHGGKHDK